MNYYYYYCLLFYPEGDLLICAFLFCFHFISPITLDIIRSRLDQGHSDRYRDVQSFINDIRLMFKHVYLFYQVYFGTHDPQHDLLSPELKLVFFCLFYSKIQKSSKPLHIWRSSSMNNWQNCYQTICQKNQTTQAETKHQMQNAYASITKYQPKSLTMMINTKPNYSAVELFPIVGIPCERPQVLRKK